MGIRVAIVDQQAKLPPELWKVGVGSFASREMGCPVDLRVGSSMG